jgi:predicted RNA-binding Zn-ribbon protein involved in translation (DUF1610 family)
MTEQRYCKSCGWEGDERDCPGRFIPACPKCGEITFHILHRREGLNIVGIFALTIAFFAAVFIALMCVGRWM